MPINTIKANEYTPPTKIIENNIARVLAKLEKASNKGTNTP